MTTSNLNLVDMGWASSMGIRVVLKMKMLQNWLAIVWEVPIGTLSNHKKN